MKFLRTLSTTRLLVLFAVIVLAATLGTAIAVASGGGGPKPAPKALAQAIHNGLAAKPPEGITARITFTNKLFPSGALTGDHASALMTGGSGRLWVRDDGRGRLELQSDAGDVQIVWGAGKVTVYDASSNTVYSATLPARKHDSGTDKARHARPSATEISDLIAKLREHASVSGALPTDVGGQAAYTVVVGPKHDGGLLGSAQLAWDAIRGVPLRFAIYAKGSSSPVLELVATEISYGPVSLDDVNLSPPANAKTIALSAPHASRQHHSAGHRLHAQAVTGLSAVRAQAGFAVIAPDTVDGLPREVVRLLGSKAAVVVYGKGLGSLLVVERKVDGSGKHQSALGSLPSVSLDGVSGHELATQLGTAIAWQRNGVAFVLAGSVPSSTAESAARALR